MAGESVGRAVIEVDVDVANAAKQINKLRGELNALERAKFAPGTKAATAAAKEVDKLNKSIHTLGGTVDKSGNFINRHAAAINQLAFSAARAGSGIANFLPLLARVTTLAAKHEFGEGGLGGALSSLKEKFSGASAAANGFGAAGGKAAGAMGGLKGAASGAASSIGAVNLAAVAAVAAVALVAVAIGILTVKLGPLGGAMNHLKNQISDTFGSAADEVNQFSTDFGHALGLSETAALTFIGRMGQLFQAQGETVQSSARIAEGLLVTAGVLRDTTIGAGTFEEALRAVQNTLAGNIEGLREYNIFITEVDLRSQAAARGIKVASGALDSQTRQLLTGLEVIDQTRERLSQQSKAQQSLAADTAKLGAAFTDIKTIIAQAFGVVLQAAVKVLGGFFDNIRKGFLFLREAVAESENFKKVIGAIAAFFSKDFKIAFGIAGLAIEGFVIALGGVIKLLDLILKPISFLVDKIAGVVNGITSALRALGLMADESDAAAEKTKKLSDAENELEQSTRRAALAHEHTREELQKSVDLYNELRDASVEAGKAIREAEQDLARTIEDNARKIEDAQRSLKKAYLDRNRAIEDANEKLSDIEVQNTRALFDARRKLDEVELQAKRAIRNAEEKLADARKDANKRVADAQKKLEEARLRRLQAILDAQLALQAAQFRFTTVAFNQAQLELTRARQSDAVKEASQKLDEERAEKKKNIGRLERDLAEEKIDQAKKVRDAEIDYARAVEDALERISDAKREQARAFADADERIAESRRRLHEVEVETNRAELDAQNKLNEVRVEQAEKVQDLIDKVNELNATMATTVEEAVVLLKILKAFGEVELPKLDTFGGIQPGASFAHGGDLAFGRVGMTGERGRELVIGGSAGSTILPHDLTERLMRILENGGGQTVHAPNVTVNEVANDPKATAFMVAAELMQGVNQ